MRFLHEWVKMPREFKKINKSLDWRAQKYFCDMDRSLWVLTITQLECLMSPTLYQNITRYTMSASRGILGEPGMIYM